MLDGHVFVGIDGMSNLGMDMTNIKSIAAAISAVILVMPSVADAGITCRGPVQKVIVTYSNGDVEIEWGWGQIKMCNVAGSVTRPYTVPVTITKEACQSMLTQALTALGTGKDFGVFVNSTLSDCMYLRDPMTGWIVDPGPQRVYIFE